MGWLKPLFTFLSILAELWKGRVDRASTPEVKHSKRLDQIDREIVRDDSAGANRRLDDWLRQVQSRKRGSGGPAGQGGAGPDGSK